MKKRLLAVVLGGMLSICMTASVFADDEIVIQNEIAVEDVAEEAAEDTNDDASAEEALTDENDNDDNEGNSESEEASDNDETDNDEDEAGEDGLTFEEDSEVETGLGVTDDVVPCKSAAYELDYTLDGQEKTATLKGIKSGGTASGELIIPETVESGGYDFTVTTIADSAFKGCSGFTGSLTIPDTVTTIGMNAFDGCSGFEELIIGTSVSLINSYAFKDCSGLTGSLTIPASVTVIGNSAFEGCSKLSGDLTIPETVTEVGADAFSGCYGLDGTLTIASKLEEYGIETRSFEGCRGLTAVNITGDVTTICGSAFDGCSNMTSVTLPDTLTTIKDSAFCDCSSLEAISIPKGVTFIGGSAFNGCSDLETIKLNNITLDSDFKLPENITYYDNAGEEIKTLAAGTAYNFTLTQTLQKFSYNVIPEDDSTVEITGCNETPSGVLTIPGTILDYKVVSIGDSAFIDRTEIAGTLEIPEGVSSIGKEAFKGCSNIAAIYLPGTLTVMGDNAIGDSESDSPEKIVLNNVCLTRPFDLPCSYYRKTGLSYSKLEAYKTYDETITKEQPPFDYKIIDEAEKEIAVSGYNGAETGVLVIPSEIDEYTVTAIGEGAFAYRTGFTGVEIPDTVREIGARAFYGCGGMTGELVIPDSVVSIGESAFDNSYYVLTGEHPVFSGSLTLSKNLVSIGAKAFANCNGLTGDLIIPDTVKSIGEGAFSTCFGFDGNLKLPANLVYIPTDAFELCSGFKGELIIPDKVVVIDSYAFYGCSGFSSVNVPSSVLYIKSNAFDENIPTIKLNNVALNLHYALGNYYDSNTRVSMLWKGKTYNVTLTTTAPKFTYKFNGNGSTSGEMSKQTVKICEAVKLTANGFKKKGYKFNGWNTRADGYGQSYQNKESVTAWSTAKGNTKTLYAQWTPNSYSIKFNGHGATSGSMKDENMKVDAQKALTANAYVKTGYTFKGWNTEKDGSGKNYGNKQSVKNLTKTDGAVITLYAQWTANKYTVKYNANGGSGSMKNQSMTYNKNAKLTKNAFTRKGYKFLGWSTDKKAAKAAYKNAAQVKNLTAKSGAAVTLYAVWKKN